MLKFLTVIMMNLIVSSLALAVDEGHETGNGGDAVVCYNQPLNSDGTGKDPAIPVVINKVELLDFWEWSQSSPLKFNADYVGMTEDAIVQDIISKVRAINNYYGYRLNEKYELFKTSSVFISRSAIAEINDAYVPYTLEKNCYVRQMARQVRNQKFGEAKYQIDAELYSKLMPIEKAGLMMHEMLYSIAIEYDDVKNSNGVRYLNFIHFSEAMKTLNQLALRDVIKGAGLAVFSNHYSLYSRLQVQDFSKYYLVSGLSPRPGFDRDTVIDDGNRLNLGANSGITFQNSETLYSNLYHDSVISIDDSTKLRILSHCERYSYLYYYRNRPSIDHCVIELKKSNDEIESFVVGTMNNNGQFGLEEQFTDLSSDYFIRFKKFKSKLELKPIINAKTSWPYVFTKNVDFGYGEYEFQKVSVKYTIENYGTVSIDADKDTLNEQKSVLRFMKNGDAYFNTDIYNNVKLDLGKGETKIAGMVNDVAFSAKADNSIYSVSMTINESDDGTKIQIGNYIYEFKERVHVDVVPNTKYTNDRTYLQLYSKEKSFLSRFTLTNVLTGKIKKFKPSRNIQMLRMSKDEAWFDGK